MNEEGTMNSKAYGAHGAHVYGFGMGYLTDQACGNQDEVEELGCKRPKRTMTQFRKTHV